VIHFIQRLLTCSELGPCPRTPVEVVPQYAPFYATPAFSSTALLTQTGLSPSHGLSLGNKG